MALNDGSLIKGVRNRVNSLRFHFAGLFIEVLRGKTNLRVQMACLEVQKHEIIGKFFKNCEFFASFWLILRHFVIFSLVST